LAQPLCETLLPLDPTVFIPTTFRHTKRLPNRISKPSHKKFHFKIVLFFFQLAIEQMITFNTSLDSEKKTLPD
jgi:hypothetical protein